MKKNDRFIWFLTSCILIFLTLSCSKHPSDEAIKESICKIERERVKSLVDGNISFARQLHTDDFELISTTGRIYSKEKYMSELESGVLDYRKWEIGDIAVRLYGNAAVIRYTDKSFEITYKGKIVGSGIVRHTNLYEKKNNQWKIVWSHATEVKVF